MTVTIEPSRAVGEVFAPPSKSIAHRLLICAALAGGTSRVRGISDCEDVRATLRCLEGLSIPYEISGDCATVWGKPLSGAEPKNPLFAGESGSTLRFLIPLALLCEKKVCFTAKPSLLSRPFGVYETLAKEKGFFFEKNEDSITVCGPLKPGDYRVPGNISSQFISGLLFALPLLPSDSRIIITTAVESRSSAPVRIVRDETYQSNIRGVYPCGEGAGYAGGILSAAADGMRCAEHIIGGNS